MSDLRISEDLALPLDAATRRMAIVGMSGCGKSSTAVQIAEQFFDARIPWVAIDGKGDWYGVRSSKDGKGPGLPIPVFGGLHGDLPLDPASGAFVASLIVEKRLTCVLDVSELDRQDMWRFLAPLGETLLRKNREVLHLFCEEADDYLPQTAASGGMQPTCLGVWQRVVKRGRFRGLGSTLLSQRNAALNKDALYQAELLIAMRATGKGDKLAIRGWVDHSGASSEIVDSLPTLDDGEGWVSSPAWLRVTKRTRFLQRRTFDAGATPVLAGGGRRVATLADVDLGEIRAAMAETIERAQAEDPAALRAQLSAVRKELAELKRAPARVEVKPIAVAALSASDRKALETVIADAESIRRLVTDLNTYVDATERRLGDASAIATKLRAALEARPQPIEVVPALGPVTVTLAEPKQAQRVEQHAQAMRNVEDHRAAQAALTKRTPAATPREGWDPVEEEQYQKWKARLLEELRAEQPALLKVATTSSEIEVTVERRVIATDGKTLRGRVAKLIAEDFYAEGRTNSATRAELKRTGPDVNNGNLHRELEGFVALGILTKESDGYRIAPGAKARIVEA